MSFPGVMVAYDVTGANYSSCPAGQRCGYDTGSQGVAWTPAMWVANPGAVHIDQSPVNTPNDEMSDVLDYENGAATLATLAPWAGAAKVSFAKDTRPGQRRPAVYMSANNVTDVVNALVAGGISGGIGLWIANWNLSQADSINAVISASGPFPVIGIQFTNTGPYDMDIFSVDWLSAQSGVAGNMVSAGSSGPAVSALQKRLAVWGEHVTADGLFGAGTDAALKAFQTARHLVPDGIAGPATWSELEASPVVTPPPPPQGVPAPADLRQSSTSAGVNVVFRWGTVAGAQAYDFQLETYRYNFGWILLNNEILATPARQLALAEGTAFRWRVAVSATGHNWSPWTQFTTSSS